MPEKMIFNTGAYTRVSREDKEAGESNSISNQKAICMEYVKNHSELNLVEIYDEDDGYTGTNMQRPGLQRMLEDVRSGKINCIISKDLSRFSRNYIDAGKYLEKVFPAMGVRYIAINDCYDSFSPQSVADTISLPFKNLVNDIYCRDISIKIRSNLDVKRKRGEYVGAFVPFGYRKAEENKNQLVVDDDAAEIVIMIFGMYKDGYSIIGIAERLNEKCIPTPMEYKKLHGMGVSTTFQKNTTPKWSYNTVSRILHNDVYTGKLTQGKRSSPNHKVPIMRLKDQSEWITVEGTHEPIIQREDFKQIQFLMKRDTRAVLEHKQKRLFSGFVFCGDCGGSMVYRTVPCGEKRYSYLICSWNRRTHECSQHSISEVQLKEIVLHAIQEQIRSIWSLHSLLEEANDLFGRNILAQRFDASIKKLDDEITDYRNRKLRLLEDMQDDILSKEEYKEYNRIYSGMIQQRQAAIKCLKQQSEAKKGELISCEWMKDFIKYHNLTDINQRALTEMVDKILIYEGKRIEILFRHRERYVDLLASIKCIPRKETVG